MRKMLIITMLVVAGLMAGCNSLKSMPDGLVMDSVTIQDSVVFTPNCQAWASINCQYPVDGNPVLADSVRRWIASCLDAKSKSATIDIPSLSNWTVRAALSGDSAEIAAVLDAEDVEDNFLFNYSYDSRISVIYENADYVTFKHELYLYRGGAHGNTARNFATFRKTGPSAGKIMGWELLSESNPHELQKSLLNGMANYLQVESANEVFDYLLIDSPSKASRKIPYPNTPPYLTKDGVTVIYQEYEVGPYAMGCPEIVVAASSPR